jgi:hypothetical protein
VRLFGMTRARAQGVDDDGHREPSSAPSLLTQRRDASQVGAGA